LFFFLRVFSNFAADLFDDLLGLPGSHFGDDALNPRPEGKNLKIEN
jgi:hypothetical protein